MKFPFIIAALLLLFSCSKQLVESTENSTQKNSTQKNSTQKPNVIFIMTDDHAKRAMSAYTNELIQTPHLDQLAAEGIQFNNAFVTNSICGPSRAVFLTGKFSHKNGFMSNRDTFDASQATLAKYLQDAGYYTAVVGKWHLKSEPQGFNEYSILLDQGEYYSPQFYNGIDTVVLEGYATNLITDKAINLLEEQKNMGKPVFMMVHQKAPHRNWMPDVSDLENGEEQYYELPETFYDDYATRSAAARNQDMRIENMFLGMDLKLYLKEKQAEETGTGGDPKAPSYSWWERDYNRMTDLQKQVWDKYYRPITDAYYANKPIGDSLLRWKYNRYMNDYLKTVKSVDDNVGRLMDYLKESGLDKNTLVIYTSDQGFFLGEHGWYDKRFMYEPSLGIPLVMRYPNGMKSGVRVDELVQNVDLAPTILTATGLEVPADMQGMPLNNFFDGKNKNPWRDGIYYHYYQTGTWHFVEKHLGIRTDRYKLIYFEDLKAWELFDLQKDPNEINNLYGKPAYAELTTQLKAQLKDLIEQYDDETAAEF